MLVLLAAFLPCLVSDKPLVKAGIDKVCSPGEMAQAQKLGSPGVQYRVNVASASRSPWVDASGWRIARSPKTPFYYDVNGETAALAAAEAFAYGADALVRTDQAGVQPFARMLSFLAQVKPANFSTLANIGVIDDGSEAAGELMNLLSRRNLLYRIVAAPDRSLAFNVKLGSKEWARSEAADPNRLAYKIRSRLTDGQRLVRVYGSEVVIVRLTGDGRRARLHLLNYSNRPVLGLRVRILGAFPKQAAAVYGVPDPLFQDVTVDAKATEFTIPELNQYAVVDLFR